ncbi:MAG: exodeoxyribonuclease VII large subunit [Porphyromonadaceae bacterium CG2_30_38_12]|nr:MAG: exodeoxyribonuclease VII large subunit [Porphyromonadaceae bacterium CG2_30_38_12]
MDSITLSELTTRIQEALRLNFDTSVWIRAEISELRENQNGHCYLEFVEKEQHTDNLLAKSKAIIWYSTYRMLKPYFESSTGQSLRAGLNVMVAVSVEFNSLYGVSLSVRDIDPTFTIGELAARRMLILRQLETDGIVDMNKQLVLSTLPQRLAIISSPTAAGYGDFIDQLEQNAAGFVFYKHLFPAIMQGEKAEASIVAALDIIYKHSDLFDAVVIIRGGGATTDLACFDSYELAANCAQFPLPILAGIGHQRDSTILDFVAYMSLKTPTAVAEFLLEKLSAQDADLNASFYAIYNFTKKRIADDWQLLTNFNWRMKQSLQQRIASKRLLLQRNNSQLRQLTQRILLNEKNRLLMLQQAIESHSPAFLLKHGYTISTLNGNRIISVKNIKTGDKIRTFVHDGDFESQVI